MSAAYDAKPASMLALQKGQKAIWHVYAEVEPGQPWRGLLTTEDEDEARALIASLRQDGGKCRLDVTIVKPRRKR